MNVVDDYRLATIRGRSNGERHDVERISLIGICRSFKRVANASCMVSFHVFHLLLHSDRIDLVLRHVACVRAFGNDFHDGAESDLLSLVKNGTDVLQFLCDRKNVGNINRARRIIATISQRIS